MSPTYKLYYFNLTGLGEPIRFLLSYGNLKFEDFRIPLPFGDDKTWPEQYKKKMPFGQMPLLEVDGKPLHQHMAICRYLGKVIGIGGANEWEDLQIDMIADTINDFRLKLVKAFWNEDPVAKEAAYKELLADAIPYYLSKLEEIAKTNNGHLANGKLTWIDVYLAGIKNTLNHMTRFDISEKYPNLGAVIRNVEAVSGIQKWIQSRPETMF